MTMTKDVLIRMENLTKYFNRSQPNEVLAVADVSLTILRGDLAVLKGPSGSGKTTLLSLIGCMARPTSGSIVVDGRDISHLPERFLTQVRRKTFGFIFQQFNLVPGMSVLQNVMLPLYPEGIGLHELKRRAADILDTLGMTKRLSFPVQGLSGGEQQRTAIARALINDPDVVLADEPTAHLDTTLSKDFMETMRRFRQQGKTVIIASHDPLVFDDEAVDLVAGMRDGRMTDLTRRS